MKVFPGPPHVLKSMDSTECPGDQAVNFHGIELRVAAVTELIRSHGENTFYYMSICARYYREKAHNELFPTRKSFPHLSREQRDSIYRRAIEMAQQDAANGIPRP